MKTIIKSIATRHQPRMKIIPIVVATLGGIVAIIALVFLGEISNLPLLMAPFGATCVLLFSVPASPLSQPINVIGGHVVSTATGMMVHAVFPSTWWALALAVGLAIGLMALLRITHPPAGADPIIVFIESVDLTYLLFPVALGSVALVVVAWIVHSLSPVTIYPLRKEE